MLKRFLLIAIALSLTVAACGGGSADPTSTPEPTPTPDPTATPATTGDAGATSIQAPPDEGPDVQQNGRTLGDPDAPVEIVEYGDFQ